jgi:RNA 3'-terminal phosphate cyclase-like protein
MTIFEHERDALAASSVVYDGAECFRSRIILSILSGKPIRIQNIRSDSTKYAQKDYFGTGRHSGVHMIGLTDDEVAFLRLIEAVTNGTSIQINNTGTCVQFKPGAILGGKVKFECPGTSNGSNSNQHLGYYLEMLIPLAPFSKNPFEITLEGVTYMDDDYIFEDDRKPLSVDMLRIVAPLILGQFGIDKHNVKIQIDKRGWAPLGKGSVTFSCPVLSPVSFGPGTPLMMHLNSIQAPIVKDLHTDVKGKIKRIRGIGLGCRISPARLSTRVKNVFGQADVLSDVQVYTDFDHGPSPGLSLSLVAETVSGALYISEGVLKTGETHEDFADRIMNELLNKIVTCHYPGCMMDPSLQWLYFLLITLSSDDVSTVQSSKLTSFSIQFLRDLKKQMGMIFRLKEKPLAHNNDIIMVSIAGVGQGFRNRGIRST